MLHAAGLVHEHARNDRDEYVRLIKENLGGNINNINMHKADTYDLNPYDYESIMQYYLKVRISNLTFINYMSGENQIDLLGLRVICVWIISKPFIVYSCTIIFSIQILITR